MTNSNITPWQTYPTAAQRALIVEALLFAAQNREDVGDLVASTRFQALHTILTTPIDLTAEQGAALADMGAEVAAGLLKTEAAMDAIMAFVNHRNIPFPSFLKVPLHSGHLAWRDARANPNDAAALAVCEFGPEKHKGERYQYPALLCYCAPYEKPARLHDDDPRYQLWVANDQQQFERIDTYRLDQAPTEGLLYSGEIAGDCFGAARQWLSGRFNEWLSIEFPQFLRDLGFQDRSYHNDTAAMAEKPLTGFTAEEGYPALICWVEHERTEDREIPEMPRFAASAYLTVEVGSGDPDETIYDGDDAVACRAAIEAWLDLRLCKDCGRVLCKCGDCHSGCFLSVPPCAAQPDLP